MKIPNFTNHLEHEENLKTPSPNITLVQLFHENAPGRAQAELLVWTPGSVLFPTLYNVAPIPCAEAAAPSKMSHQL